MATLPTERPVASLRQRMLDDMAMRAMRSRTQHDYVRHVRAFAAFLKRSPDTATAENVRCLQLHQREHGDGESVTNGAVSALRFLSRASAFLRSWVTERGSWVRSQPILTSCSRLSWWISRPPPTWKASARRRRQTTGAVERHASHSGGSGT